MAYDEMTGAKIVIQALIDQGVTDVFGYPGGAILPVYDELFQQNAVRHILVRQEGGAVHAAEGYARSTGKVGVVIVTSGPGATNAVTGIADALMDSVPLVILCGQVPTHLIGNDAFQECDTTGVTRPVTKHNYLVKSTDALARTIHEAFYVARSGRPGPVLIDLPKDVQFATGPYVPPNDVAHRTYRPKTDPDRAAVERAVEMMAEAKRPVFYCGGGVINSGERACELLTELVRMTGYPVTLTLMGLGAYPGSDRQFLGMLGMHGTYEANLAMHGCDTMIAIGSRFDDRITGRLTAFSPESRKIHVDIDPSSINKNVLVDVGIVGDVAKVLEQMIAIWKEKNVKPDQKALAAWWKQIDTWRARNSLAFNQSGDIIKPQHAIRRLYELTRGRDDVYITTEVGQHQMWAAQHYTFEKPNHWMTVGRPRHHGLRPAGGDGRTARPSRRAGRRHRRRSVDHDEHPGDVDDFAVSAAGEGVHPQQRVHGDGPAVAGAAARRPLLRELHGVVAGLREARGSLRGGRSARREGRRPR